MIEDMDVWLQRRTIQIENDPTLIDVEEQPQNIPRLPTWLRVFDAFGIVPD